MLQRFLFIGVGGSGGDTLRHLHRELSARLAPAGVKELPQGWQFLHIDTPFVPEEREGLPALRRGSYVHLVGHSLTYRTVAKSLERQGNDVWTDCVGWLPDPDEVRVAIEEGAGQFRAVGRAVTISRLREVHRKLDEAVRRLESNEAVASLAAVHLALRGEPPTGAARSPVVLVVSSLAGGTGSGVFLDVCDLLRGMGPKWATDSTAILYAPDVFHALGGDKRQGVHANALAAVSELLSGYWNSGSGDDPVHRAMGVVRTDDSSRRGPERSLLVGVGNGRLTFRDQNEVFAAVGRTIAAWALSPSIQQQYLAYVRSNWQQSASGPDPLSLVDTDVEAPFSALGYASVGLGRGLFHQYAAQCLARAAADRLLYGSGGVAGTEELAAVNRDTVIRRRWPSFVEKLQLHSPGKKPAEALRRVLSPPRDPAVQAVKEEIRRAAGDQQHPFRSWQQILGGLIEDRREGFHREQRALLWERAATWVTEIQQLLRQELEKSLTVDGLPVTEGIVRALARHLLEEVVPQLEHHAQADSRQAMSYQQEIDSALAVVEHRFRRVRQAYPHHKQVVDALDRAVEAAFGRALDAEVRRLSARMLRDLAEHLLEPLREALYQGLQALRRGAVAGADGRVPVVGQWPAAPVFQVPPALQPARTQLLVDPVEDFPATFQSLLAASVSGIPHEGDALMFVVDQILSAAALGQAASAPAGAATIEALVTQVRTWRPEASRLWTDSREVEQSASFRVCTSAEDLLHRATVWSGDLNHRMGAYIHQSLSEALGGERPTDAQRERLRRFGTCLAEAVRAAAPLVDLDPAYAAWQTDHATEPPVPMITPIPLAEGTPAYETALNVLVDHAGMTVEAAQHLFDGAGGNDIELTTFLGRPLHPIAFASLTRPILEDWRRKNSGPRRRSSFTRWRRARPLPRAVPLTPSALARLARGWFTVVLRDERWFEEEGRRIKIATADFGSLPFPFPLLGEAPAIDDSFDGLAAIVESLPLILVESLVDDVPLQAYQRLIFLGRPGRHEDSLTADHEADLVKLKDQANRRYSADGPAKVQRDWELRHEIHAALDALLDVVHGGPR